jgi:exopolysaccharide biosynthesis WecB/TagA/CpsF family protein
MDDAELKIDDTEFLGTYFHKFNFDETLFWLKSRSNSDKFAYIVTPNVDHIVRLNGSDEQFTLAYKSATLRLCDSRILSRLASLVGIALPAVPGSDLVAALFGRVISAGDCIAIIGSTRATLDQLKSRFPDIDLRQIEAPMGLRENSIAREAIISDTIAQDARFILIAVGSPQQEILARELGEDQRSRGTALCIGASIDFMVGKQIRAPRALQRLGMEWAWRLGTNPRRLWRRYLIEGPKIFLIFYRWGKQHKRHKPAQ